MAVILTDPRGLVLDRRASHSLLRKLDRILLAPGHLYSEDTVGTNGIGTAAEDGSAFVVGGEHYTEWLRDLSCAGAAIRDPITGRIEGVLDLTCRVEDTSPLMVPFINQAAHEIEEQLYDDAPPLASQVLASRVDAAIRAAEARAAAEERRRLASELHDSVTQALYGITLGVNTARDLLRNRPGEVAEPLEYVRELATTGLTEVRSLISDLRSESVAKEGLVVALSKASATVEAHHPVSVERRLPNEPMASLTTKEALFRIGQEAMRNIVKHAGATRVRIRLETQPPDLLLEITDDGIGFDTREDFPGHFGLRSMDERAVQLGGQFDVSTAPGRGTRITARIPASAGTI
jgi:signal transduction histidine kinase